MVHRVRLVLALIVLSAFVLPLTGAKIATAASSNTVTASAECVRVLGSTSGLPKIEVTITNNSGEPLHIAYLRAFGTAQDLQGGLTGMKMEQPKADPDLVIEDGDTKVIEAEWGGVDLTRGDAIVALILTNAGLLLPGCADGQPQSLTLPDNPSKADFAEIGAKMIGQLESLRAYPALYALMHPDGQQAVSFEAMSCWYIARFGPPVTGDVKTIYSTDIEKVKLLDWTWGVNGKSYKDAAEVTQTQKIGVSSDEGEPAESTIHLVDAKNVWRWFFGSTPEGVASMSASCDLPDSV